MPAPAGELGYRFGTEIASDAVLLGAARLGRPPAADSLAEVGRGAGAVFPVTGRHLPGPAGPAIGQELRRLQGGGFAPDPMPGGGVGRARHHRQRRGADIHRDPGTEDALADAGFRADTLGRIAALHRIGKPVEVSGAVLFLASPAASLVTGHTLAIDGGWTAR